MKSSSPRSDQPFKIQLLLASDPNRALLRDLIAPIYQVEDVTHLETPKSEAQAADLIITDSTQLIAHNEVFQKLTLRLLRPKVLLLHRVKEDEIPKPVIDLIDDSLQIPSTKSMVHRRITSLLQAKKLENDLFSAKMEADLANSAKTTFLANMSHEIRTPLGAIMGFNELLRNPEISDEEKSNYLDVVDRNAHQLMSLVDDILDLSKVESGHLKLEIIEFSLPDLIAELYSGLVLKAKSKGIQFLVTPQSPLPETVKSDPTRIRQILNNVVGNAIKFTSKGLVELKIALNESTLILTVTDTGPGMTIQQAENLFQPFHQADLSTQRKFGGTGLGLVLTRRLCEALGGRFYLERTVPKVGSEFIAEFKVDLMEEPGWIDIDQFQLTPIRAIKKAQQIGGLEGLNILVVEDSPDNQVLISLILRKARAQFEIASNGHEALEKIDNKDFDVVLLDIQMPGMDGHQVARVIRDRAFKMPVVALTAHAMQEEREKAEESGFSDYLTKPIQREVLLDLLASFMN